LYNFSTYAMMPQTLWTTRNKQ